MYRTARSQRRRHVYMNRGGTTRLQNNQGAFRMVKTGGDTKRKGRSRRNIRYTLGAGGRRRPARSRRRHAIRRGGGAGDIDLLRTSVQRYHANLFIHNMHMYDTEIDNHLDNFPTILGYAELQAFGTDTTLNLYSGVTLTSSPRTYWRVKKCVVVIAAVDKDSLQDVWDAYLQENSQKKWTPYKAALKRRRKKQKNYGEKVKVTMQNALAQVNLDTDVIKTVTRFKQIFEKLKGVVEQEQLNVVLTLTVFTLDSRLDKHGDFVPILRGKYGYTVLPSTTINGDTSLTIQNLQKRKQLNAIEFWPPSVDSVDGNGAVQADAK